jgi:hypothetical protein
MSHIHPASQLSLSYTGRPDGSGDVGLGPRVKKQGTGGFEAFVVGVGVEDV